MNTEVFPVGGSRDAVYKFLRDRGFQMSSYSDKHWTNIDGIKLHVYGAGSMVKVYDKNKSVIYDGPLGGVYF